MLLFSLEAMLLPHLAEAGHPEMSREGPALLERSLLGFPDGLAEPEFPGLFSPESVSRVDHNSYRQFRNKISNDPWVILA